MMWSIHRSTYLIGFLTFIFIGGCTEPKQPPSADLKDLPDRIKKLDRLTVYQAESQSYDTVEFVREQVFESNEKVFIEGYISKIAVDEDNNVYIVGFMPGTLGLYVFKPDGSFVTKFLREGRGPGEFESISSMLIKNKKLYILGPRLQKVGIFSLDDYSLIEDYLIGRGQFKKVDSLRTIRATKIKAVGDDGTMIMKFQDNNYTNPNRNETNLFYKLSDEAEVISGNLLETGRHKVYQTGMERTSEGTVVIPFYCPLTEIL